MMLTLAWNQAQAMNLSQAIQSTLDNHPELRADISRRLSADQEAKIAQGGYLPTVDLLASYGRENTDNPTTRFSGGHDETLNARTAELRLRQMVFDGFNTPNEIARSKDVVNSRAYRVLGSSESLALRTVEMYLEVLKRRELVALADENLKSHLRVTDQMGLRHERGVGSTADLDQSEARRALAENNLYTEQVNLADAEASFYAVVGVMPDQLEAPPSIRPRLPASLEEARQQVMSNNPMLKSAQADIQAAEKQYEIAKSPMYPRFDIELATSADDNLQGEEGHYNTWRAGVVMNYNLFNGNRDKARLEATSHQINEAMDIRNNALRQLNENLALAWNAMENARRQTPRAREYAESSTRVRSAYQQQFGLGQRTLLDLLDSDNELFTANRRYVEVRYNEEYSMYRVIAAMGDLLRVQNIVPPSEAIAVSDVKSQARLPEMR
jgi:adhesin transport system outer membrane protein